MAAAAPRAGCGRNRRRARIAVSALALGLFGTGTISSVGAEPAGPSLASAVKAAYLLKFAPYVAWPQAGGGAFVICIVGHDPFGGLLDRVAQGQAIAERPVIVRRMDEIDAGAPCQVAFLGGGKRQSVAQALAAVRRAPVLTITDGAIGTARGMIHFELTGDRVRFLIDDQAAAVSALSISSKLLSLALSVRTRAG